MDQMKKSILCLLLLVVIVFCSAKTINIDDSETSVRVISSDNNGIRLEFKFGAFEADPVEINGVTYHQLKIPGEPVTYQKGEPELPFFANSIMIPEQTGIIVYLVENDTKEYPYIPVPSKGNLLRTVDPETVPWTFSETYKSDNIYPASLVEAGEPYVLREVRGAVIKANPFVYDARRNIVTVHHRIVVDVRFEGTSTINTLDVRPSTYTREFEEIYSHQFINFEQDRYTSMAETGKILVICYPDFMAAMQPYVDWKQQKGINTQIVDVSTIGTTANQIKDYIQTQYNLGGLAFVQLVGDAAQIPTFQYLDGGSDPSYSLLAGSDNYPDIFVGRFSAETGEQVTNEVNKTIYYERDMGAGDWLAKGTGIGSEQGDGIGDEGQADYVHIGAIRTQLLNYGYSEVDEFYGTNGATAAMVTTALNSGRGVLNYCGHGSAGSWGTTGFNTTNINALTNDYKLPFIHSVACVNGDFDASTCFAEVWLRAKNNSNSNPTGAVAFYGSSINQSWAPPMEAQDETNILLTNDSKHTIGGLWYNGSCSMIEDYGTGGGDMFKTWHIFGDASLMVRTANPTAITATYDALLSTGQTSLYIDTNTAGATVTLWKSGIIYGSGVANSSGNITLTLNPPVSESGTYLLTATQFNKITYSGALQFSNPDLRIWTGSVSTDWNNASNWNNNQIPTPVDDAFIPQGLTNYPVTAVDYGMCRDLTIGSGANVTVNANILYIYRDAFIFGTLKMNHSASNLLVANNMYWETGSQAEITNSAAAITCNGSVFFESGSNVQMNMGNLRFESTESSYIVNNSSNTQLNNLYSAKHTSAFLAFSADSTQPITINGNIVNLESRTMYNYYPGNIILKGNLTSENTGLSGGLLWHFGTLVMDGINQTISFANASSYINNLIASQSGTLTYTNALAVKGNLTVENGSGITIGASHLTVEGDANFWGQLIMNSATGNLYVTGSINWEAGSTANITNASADIYCQGNMYFDTASNVLMTMGYIEFHGSGESAIFNNKSTTQIFNLRSNKTAPGYLYISASSTATFTIGGSIWNYQNRIFNNFYTGNTVLKGNLNNYNTNTNGFTWETGTLLLSGTNHSISLPNANDCVNNLTLNHTGTVTISYDLKIKGNLSLSNGTFSPGAYLVYVGGNWTKTTSAVFTYTNSTVIFNGSSTQTISSTAFNILRMNKSGGNLKINTGSIVSAQSYKYDLGTIEVAGGTFTVYDLADNNIKGNYILSSGAINLTQDNTYFVDLDANLNISGGLFSINGGYNFPADWAYTRNINITMSGGVLDWGTHSIGITNTGYAVTFNLTGGTIRTQGSISIDRPNVHFNGGTLEMYGTTDATISNVSTASFYDLNINKASSREDNNRNERSNTVTLAGNITVDNDLIVTGGTLDMDTYTCVVTNNALIYGTLNMTQSGAVLQVVKDITWYTGSTGNITAGVFNIKRNWTNQNGITLQIGTGNNVNFTGTSSAILSLADPTASFGNIIINKTSGSVFVNTDTQYLNVAGNLTINSINNLNFRNSTSTVDGILTVNGTATLMESSILDVNDINLVGMMSMTNATVNVGHNFVQQTTGNLTINSGSFNIDAPYTGTLYAFAGTTNLNGGAFQITNDGIILGASTHFNHNGGTLKLGWGFQATTAGAFQPTQGAVEFIGARSAFIQCNNGNYFHDLIFNKPGTSYSTTFSTDITVNNDLIVQGGNASLGAHTLTVNRDVIINGGWLTASNAADIINVGRNWTNNVNTNAFAQGSGKVNFFSSLAATISTETFYNVIINKTSTNVNDLILTSGNTMTTNGYLDIVCGCLNVAPGAILDTNGSVTIESSGGLDVNSSGTPTTFRVAGTLYDEGDEVGTGIGLSAIIGTTLIFDGIVDQYIGADYTSQTMNLCNVTINKSSGRVLSYNNMNFMGNFTLTNGEWAYATAGKTKSFYGDMLIDLNGIFSDSTGTSNLLSSIDSNLKILGIAKFGAFNINKSVSNNINLTGNTIFSGTTTITLTAGILNLNAYTMKYKGSLAIGSDGKLNLTGGSVLNINDTSTLSIGIGGEFVSLGTISNPAKLTSDIGYYAFNTTTNSLVAADYTIFEKMNTNGINIASRCAVDTTHCFYHCTFQNGASGGTLLKINCQNYLTVTGAVFPANTWHGLYNVSRTYAFGSVSFRSYTGAFSGSAYDYTTNGSIIWEAIVPPDAPQNIQISIANDEATITWDEVIGATGYNIYRSFIPDVFTEDDWIGSTESTSYGDESVNIYPKAFYMIKAYVE